MAQLNFNPQQYEPAGEFKPLPAGEYVATIVKSDRKPTKKQTGFYLEFQFEIQSPPAHKGRNVTARMNTENTNPTAAEIGRREVRSLCDACGVPAPNDTVQLHGLPIMIEVGLEKRDDKPGEFSNVIKSFKPRSAGVPPADQNQQQNAGAAQQTGQQQETAPWGAQAQ